MGHKNKPKNAGIIITAVIVAANLSSCAAPQKWGEELGVVDYNKIITALFCEVIDAWEFDRIRKINSNLPFERQIYTPEQALAANFWKSAEQPEWKVTTTIKHRKTGEGSISAGWTYNKLVDDWTRKKPLAGSINDTSYYEGASKIEAVFPTVYLPGNSKKDNHFDRFRDNCDNPGPKYANLSSLLISNHFIKYLKGYDDNSSDDLPRKGASAILGELVYSDIANITGSFDPTYTFVMAPVTKIYGLKLNGKNNIDIRISVIRKAYSPARPLEISNLQILVNQDLADRIANAISNGKKVIEGKSLPLRGVVSKRPRTFIQSQPELLRSERILEDAIEDTIRDRQLK